MPARFRRTVSPRNVSPVLAPSEILTCPKTLSMCESQNGKAKSRKAQLVAQIARLVKKAGLDYEGWRYVAKRVRKICELRPEKKGRRLPRVLTTDEFRRFYQIVDRAEDVQHALMLRLLFYTAVRVTELCNFGVSDVDLEACKIRVNLGKGSKDRYVLFGKGFATALRTHISAHPHNRWVFQTQRHGKFSTQTSPADRLQVRRRGWRQSDPSHVSTPSDHLADPALWSWRCRASTDHGSCPA